MFQLYFPVSYKRPVKATTKLSTNAYLKYPEFLWFWDQTQCSVPSLNVQGFMQLNLVGFFLRHHFLVSSAGFCGCHHHRVSHWEWDYFLCTSQTTALLSGYTGVPVTGSPPLTPNFTGLSTLALIWHLVTVFRAHPYAPAGLALICWCSPTVLRLWELSHKHQLKD